MEKPAKNKTITFIENAAIKGREDNYAQIQIKVPRVVESWRGSLYSFEWLLEDGRVKDLKELPENEQPKRKAVEQAIQNGEPLEMPILGIGIMENVEIGIGKATLLTLAAQGHDTALVHIPKANESDFKDFLADVE